MTYKDFKKHFQDRAIKEYGFKKIGSRVYYINDDVIIVFDIVKSVYSNSLSRFDLGVTLIEASKFKVEKMEQIDSDSSDIGVSLVDGKYVELDEIDDFNKYDEIFDEYFKVIFPKLLSISSIREMIKSGELYSRDRIKNFLNLN